MPSSTASQSVTVSICTFCCIGLVTSNSTSAHLVWLPADQWYRSSQTRKDSMRFWTFIVTLTFKTIIQFLHKTLQLIMMYHTINFGCKIISGSVDIIETVISENTSLHCNLDLEDCWQIFLQKTLAHDDASQYQVWLQIVWQLRRFRPHEHSLEFWTFPVTLILTITQQSNPILLQDSPPYDNVPSKQV